MFHNDAIFWVEVEKIQPNPFQPRREFDEKKLNDLAESIRQYGVLQPLVVTRKEVFTEDGGMQVEYELIAGERRLRASKVAGIGQVPVVVREDEEDEGVKLELAIIENLQREDLNPIDRARAFNRLAHEFGYKHGDVARKVGKSREYVANTVRLLRLPEEMMQAVIDGKITEGHTRPLLMLSDRPEEQMTLFKEITHYKLKVREAEKISRRFAYEKVRSQKTAISPSIIELEEQTSKLLGTRVRIDKSGRAGKVSISFGSEEDLHSILDTLRTGAVGEISPNAEQTPQLAEDERIEDSGTERPMVTYLTSEIVVDEEPLEKSEEQDKNESDDLYTVSNFTV